MPLGAPINLTFYDPETNEVIETYSKTFVPWGILKTAIRLQGIMAQEQMSESDIDAINGLIVEFYGGRFTADQLEKCTSLDESMAVITAIMSRLEGDLPGLGKGNPTLPGRG